MQQTASSFDHLIGSCEQRRRYSEAQRLSGLEINHQCVPGRHLHRQVGVASRLEDAIDVTGRPLVRVDRIRPIGGESPSRGIVSVRWTFGRRYLVASEMIRLRRVSCDWLPVTIRPPFRSRANAPMARSISPGSRTSIGVNSPTSDAGQGLDRGELADPGS